MCKTQSSFGEPAIPGDRAGRQERLLLSRVYLPVLLLFLISTIPSSAQLHSKAKQGDFAWCVMLYVR